MSRVLLLVLLVVIVVVVVFERERGRGRKRNIVVKENIDKLLPVHTLTRDRTSNPGMCLDWESNPQTFGARGDAPTN